MRFRRAHRRETDKTPSGRFVSSVTDNVTATTLAPALVLGLLAFAFNPSFVGASSVVLIVILVWLGRREPVIDNPYFLFLVTPISLLMYSDRVSAQFLPPMDGVVQFWIAVGNFSFLAGLLFIKSVSPSVTPARGGDYSYVAILTLGLIPHILGVLNAGFPILSSDVNGARNAYTLPIIGQFSVFLPLTILIAFQRKNVKLIMYSVVLNVFLSVMMASKFSILYTFLFFLYAYARYDGRALFGWRPFHLVMIGVVIIPFIFEFIFSAREAGVQSDYYWRQQVNFKYGALDRFGDFTYLPYMYLTTPWSNLSYLFELEPYLTYGARSIHSLLSVFQLDELVSLPPLKVRNQVFNTHAYLADFFVDFGVFGVVLLSFVLGAIVKWVYVGSLKSSDALIGGVWVSFAFATFNLFFSNHFTGVGYPVVTLVLFSAYRLVHRVLIGAARNAST